MSSITMTGDGKRWIHRYIFENMKNTSLIILDEVGKGYSPKEVVMVVGPVTSTGCAYHGPFWSNSRYVHSRIDLRLHFIASLPLIILMYLECSIDDE